WWQGRCIVIYAGRAAVTTLARHVRCGARFLKGATLRSVFPVRDTACPHSDGSVLRRLRGRSGKGGGHHGGGRARAGVRVPAVARKPQARAREKTRRCGGGDLLLQRVRAPAREGRAEA